MQLLISVFQGEQRKVFRHNTGLLDYASNAGFEVVDTFNMTMARYKDFVQGKCACHFHKVRLSQCVFILEGVLVYKGILDVPLLGVAFAQEIPKFGSYFLQKYP